MECDRCKHIAVPIWYEPCRSCFMDSFMDAMGCVTTWLGDYSPYTCEKCGYHVDSKTRYCPECGRKASNYEDRVD